MLPRSANTPLTITRLWRSRRHLRQLLAVYPAERPRDFLIERRRRSSTLVAGRAQRYVDTQPVASEDVDKIIPDVRPIEEAPAQVLEFGDVTPERIRSLCQERVPGWSQVDSQDICIDQICEGLSNQNFKVYPQTASFHLHPYSITPCVLFRIYGKDASKLYDVERDLEVVKLLASYQIGPAIYAWGEGYRIEEWHFSAPLPNRRMRNPSIFAQAAAQLGRLHKLSGRNDFPSSIRDAEVLSAVRIETWLNASMGAASEFKTSAFAKQFEALDFDDIVAEKPWISEFVVDGNPSIRGSGLDVVFSHWDYQENNILQTHYGLRCIDFEYSGMEYQAYDIAAYFVECTIDYLVNEYPFFKVSLSDFPTDAQQRMFCAIYLSEYLDTDVQPDDLAVSVLQERVNRFVLLSHYLWTHWSVIRASQSPTFNSFDYLQYAQHRWFMYKWAKRAMLHQ